MFLTSSMRRLSRAEVGLDDARARHRFRRLGVRNLFAVVQHHYAVAHRLHDPHHMLGQQHRYAVIGAHAPDGLDQALHHPRPDSPPTLPHPPPPPPHSPPGGGPREEAPPGHGETLSTPNPPHLRGGAAAPWRSPAPRRRHA